MQDRIVGYCLDCEEPIYLVWNASRTFKFALDHMHKNEANSWCVANLPLNGQSMDSSQQIPELVTGRHRVTCAVQQAVTEDGVDHPAPEPRACPRTLQSERLTPTIASQ